MSLSRFSRIDVAASLSFRDASRSVLASSPAVCSHLLLERGHFGLELVLALAQLLDFLLPRIAGAIEPFDAFRDLLLFARDLIGLPQCVLDIALGAARLRLLQPLLRLLQSIERGGRLRGARLPVGRRLPHLVGRLAKLPCGVAELRPVLFPRQLLEAARRLLDLFGE